MGHLEITKIQSFRDVTILIYINVSQKKMFENYHPRRCSYRIHNTIETGMVLFFFFDRTLEFLLKEEISGNRKNSNSDARKTKQPNTKSQ